MSERGYPEAREVGRAEIVEEWHYYDGFREGVVRVEGKLYVASTVDYAQDSWRYYARELFFVVNGVPNPNYSVDGGIITFTSRELTHAHARDLSTESAKVEHATSGAGAL